jgi:hypothetical protein
MNQQIVATSFFNRPLHEAVVILQLLYFFFLIYAIPS